MASSVFIVNFEQAIASWFTILILTHLLRLDTYTLVRWSLRNRLRVKYGPESCFSRLHSYRNYLLQILYSMPDLKEFKILRLK